MSDDERKPFHCRQCGAPLIQTSEQHSCCPNGHGGLRPPLPRKVRQLNHARIAGLPTATCDVHQAGSVYLVEGRKYRRLKIYARKIDGRPTLPAGQIVAIFDADVLLLEEIRKDSQP